MNRTKSGKHILARTPYNQITAALSLGVFMTVFVLAGWIGLLVVLVLWLAALLYAGYAGTRREFAEAARMREKDRRAHEDLISRRRRLGQHMDMTYEERSPALAARFGRVDQDVAENGDPRHTASARHAAELVAEGVLRVPLGGFPVAVFDLEVVNEFDLGNLAGMGRADQAVESAKCYLTVCAVTLPYPLPYLSALAAWNTGQVEEIAPAVDSGVPVELRHTDDPRFAALVLSVPEVLRAAHNLDLLWTVSGDQLVAAAMTSTGITPESALRRATDLAALAGAFPWSRLEPYRRDTTGVPVPWQLHRSPFLVHQWWMQSDLLGPGVLRWAHVPLGATGMYAFASIGTDLGEPCRDPGDGLSSRAFTPAQPGSGGDGQCGGVV